MAVSAPIVLNTSRKVIGVVILVNIRQFPPPSLHSFSSLHLFPACHLRSKANTLTSIGCFIAVAIYKAPLKLISAMKGSREKQGTTQRKLKVTWAPDVYDPIPTSVSHAPRRSTRQHKASRKDKRHGKKGHKGKDSPRGSGSGSGSKDSSSDGKDKRKKKKKHSAQPSMSSSSCYKSPHTGNGVLVLKPDQVENCGMGILDTSCGDSFLKMSLAKAHYPLAEAL